MQKKLTKNEQKTLKLLLKNAKISDAAIALKLKISSQAVGKIRRKLEKTVINQYTLSVDYAQLGINLFAITNTSLSAEGLKKSEEVERKLMSNPHILQMYKLPSGRPSYNILYGFSDMNELESFFQGKEKKNEVHRLVENKNLVTFSGSNIIKDNKENLIVKAIDSDKLNRSTKK